MEDQLKQPSNVRRQNIVIFVLVILSAIAMFAYIHWKNDKQNNNYRVRELIAKYYLRHASSRVTFDIAMTITPRERFLQKTTQPVIAMQPSIRLYGAHFKIDQASGRLESGQNVPVEIRHSDHRAYIDPQRPYDAPYTTIGCSLRAERRQTVVVRLTFEAEDFIVAAEDLNAFHVWGFKTLNTSDIEPYLLSGFPRVAVGSHELIFPEGANPEYFFFSDYNGPGKRWKESFDGKRYHLICSQKPLDDLRVLFKYRGPGQPHPDLHDNIQKRILRKLDRQVEIYFRTVKKRDIQWRERKTEPDYFALFFGGLAVVIVGLVIWAGAKSAKQPAEGGKAKSAGTLLEAKQAEDVVGRTGLFIVLLAVGIAGLMLVFSALTWVLHKFGIPFPPN